MGKKNKNIFFEEDKKDAMKISQLGVEEEKDKKYKYMKGWFLFYFVFIGIFLGWSWIGQPTLMAKQTVEFYAFLFLIPTMAILFDLGTSKAYSYIDTVTYQAPRISMKIH